MPLPNDLLDALDPIRVGARTGSVPRPTSPFAAPPRRPMPDSAYTPKVGNYYRPSMGDVLSNPVEHAARFLGGVADDPTTPKVAKWGGDLYDRLAGAASTRSLVGGQGVRNAAKQFVAPSLIKPDAAMTPAPQAPTGREINQRYGLSSPDDRFGGLKGFATEMALDPMSIAGAVIHGPQALRGLGRAMTKEVALPGGGFATTLRTVADEAVHREAGQMARPSLAAGEAGAQSFGYPGAPFAEKGYEHTGRARAMSVVEDVLKSKGVQGREYGDLRDNLFNGLYKNLDRKYPGTNWVYADNFPEPAVQAFAAKHGVQLPPLPPQTYQSPGNATQGLNWDSLLDRMNRPLVGRLQGIPSFESQQSAKLGVAETLQGMLAGGRAEGTRAGRLWHIADQHGVPVRFHDPDRLMEGIAHYDPRLNAGLGGIELNPKDHQYWTGLGGEVMPHDKGYLAGGNHIDQTAWHELAHHLHMGGVEGSRDLAAHFDRIGLPRNRPFGAHGLTPELSEIAGRVSDYAKKDPYELVAETATGRLTQGENYPAPINAAYNGLRGPAMDRFDLSGSIRRLKEFAGGESGAARLGDAADEGAHGLTREQLAHEDALFGQPAEGEALGNELLGGRAATTADAEGLHARLRQLNESIRGFGQDEAGWLRHKAPGIPDEMQNAADALGPEYPGGVEKLRRIAEATRGEPIPKQYDRYGSTIDGLVRDPYQRLIDLSNSPLAERIAGEIPEGSRYLGGGVEAMAFEGPGNHIVRVMDDTRYNSVNKRPEMPEMLQAFRETQVGPHTIEHLPRVQPMQMGEANAERIADALARRVDQADLSPWDVGGHNVGLTPEGNAIVFDGGAIKEGHFAGLGGREIPRKPTYQLDDPAMADVLRGMGGPESVRRSLEMGLADGTRGQGVPFHDLADLLAESLKRQSGRGRPAASSALADFRPSPRFDPSSSPSGIPVGAFTTPTNAPHLAKLLGVGAATGVGAGLGQYLLTPRGGQSGATQRLR